jgi:hypothetical protein
MKSKEIIFFAIILISALIAQHLWLKAKLTNNKNTSPISADTKTIQNHDQYFIFSPEVSGNASTPLIEDFYKEEILIAYKPVADSLYWY